MGIKGKVGFDEGFRTASGRPYEGLWVKWSPMIKSGEEFE